MFRDDPTARDWLCARPRRRAGGLAGEPDEVDRASDTRRSPGHSGRLDKRHHNALRASGESRGETVSHGGGSRRTGAAHARAPRAGRDRPAAGEGDRPGRLQRFLDGFGDQGPAGRPDVARRRARRRPRAGSSGRRENPGREPQAQLQRSRVHERVGPLHHARRAGLDVSRRLQQRLSDFPDAGLHHHPLRDDSRRPHHPARSRARTRRRRSATGWATRARAGKGIRWSST